MRKFLIMLSLALPFAAIGFGSAWAGTVSMTGDHASVGGTDICGACHTPHSAGGTEIPLWGQTTTTATFTMYAATQSMDNAIGAVPGSVSKACLSCHDGVTVIDAKGATMGGGAVGTDLSSNHPIAVTYDETADIGLEVQATVEASLPLYGDTVGCASCHNPHDNSNGKYLRVSNNNSALCATCHLK